MTSDIFDTPFGTLDVIIAAVLLSQGIEGVTLSQRDATGRPPAEIAEDNARLFIRNFGDRKIDAVRAVREVTGLGFRDAENAVFQVFETYDDREKRQFVVKIAFEDHGEGLRDMPAKDVTRLIDDQLSGDLGDGLRCIGVDVLREW